MAPLNRLTLLVRATRARPVAGRRIFNSRVARRGYASEGDHAPPSSDLPWLIGSIAATAGGLYVIWPSSSGGHGGDHGHGHGKEEHKEEEEPAEEEESKDEGKEESDESKDESKDEGKDDEKADSKDEGKDDDSEDKKEEKDESDKEEKKDDKDEGDEDKEDDKAEDKEEDKSSSGEKRTPYEKYDGKPKGGKENTSSQEGPDHTGARHASGPHSDQEKSKKGEGTVETARVKGTIDPKRKQV